MTSAWQLETGHLTCRWSEFGQPVRYNPGWMQESSEPQTGYLTPIPDFVNRSPFGGIFCYQPDPTEGD